MAIGSITVFSNRFKTDESITIFLHRCKAGFMNYKNVLKGFLFFFSVSFLFPVLATGIGVNVTPVVTPPSPATPASVPCYRFQSDTVWAKLTVLVQDLHGRFHLECQCDSPTSRWFLKESKNGRIVAHGTMDTANRFQADIPRSFQDGDLLTVIVKGDQGDMPSVTRLSPDAEQVWSTPTPLPYDAFEDNPKRPYNKIVRNFYEQAIQAYTTGDNENAQVYLEKAGELDPDQPQVQALRKKIRPLSPVPQSHEAQETPRVQSGKSSVENLLEKAEAAEQSDNPSKARKLYLKILKQDPGNEKARQSLLRLKTGSLEGIAQKLEKALSAGDTATAKKALDRLKRDAPTDPRLGGWQEKLDRLVRPDSQGQQSKADEVYNLGLESYRKEDYASAKKFWEETLELQPNHLQARRNLERLREEHPELK
jgi:tetratricopeptide (TPR) repeat protein